MQITLILRPLKDDILGDRGANNCHSHIMYAFQSEICIWKSSSKSFKILEKSED